MGSKLYKELMSLNQSQMNKFDKVYTQIKTGNWDGLDIIPLKGKPDCYRVRVGNMRMQFKKYESGEYELLSYRKRNEKTYK